MKNVTSIEVQSPNKQDKASHCHQACLTAFGEGAAVTIVDMKSDVRRPIKIIQRPPVCYKMSIPCISWGYGITPNDKNSSGHLLAVSWDKTIKLMSVKDDSQELEIVGCGYYCSEFEIN